MVSGALWGMLTSRPLGQHQAGPLAARPYTGRWLLGPSLASGPVNSMCGAGESDETRWAEVPAPPQSLSGSQRAGSRLLIFVG